MTNPFATALSALHASDLAVAAVYRVGGTGSPLAVRVIHSRPQDDYRVADVRVVLPTNSLSIRKADVAAPQIGDTIEIAAVIYRINQTPELDVEGLAWTCYAEAVT